MREIRPARLWIANTLEARDYRPLLDRGICAIVDVAMEEKPAAPPREMIYLRHPLYDGSGNPPDNLSLAIEAIVRLLERKLPTLVACSAGMSRSPALVAAALSVVERADPQQLLQSLAAGGPLDVSPLFWQEILSVGLPRT